MCGRFCLKKLSMDGLPSYCRHDGRHFRTSLRRHQTRQIRTIQNEHYCMFAILDPSYPLLHPDSLRLRADTDAALIGQQSPRFVRRLGVPPLLIKSRTHHDIQRSLCKFEINLVCFPSTEISIHAGVSHRPHPAENTAGAALISQTDRQVELPVDQH